MDHPLIDLINARIAAAERDGAFDNLPGAGKPLAPCDDPGNAAINRILRDNGALPEAAQVMRDISDLRDALRATADRTERSRILRDISLLETRLDIARRR